MPGRLTEQDLEIFAAQFTGGFTGPLNRYRNIDRNWALTAAFDGGRLQMPAQFIAGDLDPVMAFRGLRDVASAPPRLHDRIREPVFLPGLRSLCPAGAPEEVNRVLLDVLGSLK
jgi:epoxide hydrolase A/B